MTRKNKTQLTAALFMNIVIVIMETVGCILTLNRIGTETFVYYTTDSNLFSLIVSGIFAVFAAKALRNNRPDDIPQWVRVLKLMSVTCLAVTFIVVVTVLAPVHEGGYMHMLFDSDLLYYHLLCPVLSILSYIFFELHTDLKVKHSLIATIPTLLYAIVTIILNILYIIHGPYPFLYVYEQSLLMSCIWFIVIVGGAFIVSMPIRILGKVFSKP